MPYVDEEQITHYDKAREAAERERDHAIDALSTKEERTQEILRDLEAAQEEAARLREEVTLVRAAFHDYDQRIARLREERDAYKSIAEQHAKTLAALDAGGTNRADWDGLYNSYDAGR